MGYRVLRDALPLQGERITLRLFEPSDADALYVLHSDPVLTRYAGGLKTREESLASLQRIVARTHDTGFGALAVEERLSGRVIGWCGVQRFTDRSAFEVIYALTPTMWGRGFALEAATLVMSAAFDLEDHPLETIYGLVFPENIRSVRVLKRLGMSFVEDVYDQQSERYASLYKVTRRSFEEQRTQASSSK